MESISAYQALIEAREVWGTLAYDFGKDRSDADKEMWCTIAAFDGDRYPAHLV